MRLHNSNIWIRPTAYVKNKRLLIISLHFWIRSLKLISGIRYMLSIYIEYTSPIMSSYGSWIYNYRCNQCLSQHYMIKFVSDLLQVGGFQTFVFDVSGWSYSNIRVVQSQCNFPSLKKYTMKMSRCNKKKNQIHLWWINHPIRTWHFN
jgi:hypothetical protein